MTNFEKHYSKIKSIASKGSTVGKIGTVIDSCNRLSCAKCEFYYAVKGRINGNCKSRSLQWMCEEYIEPIKLTHKQLAILKILETGWLARDDIFPKNLYWYSEKPTRRNNHFENVNCKLMCVRGIFDAFDFITFKDEPFSVEEMLKWEVVND